MNKVSLISERARPEDQNSTLATNQKDVTMNSAYSCNSHSRLKLYHETVTIINWFRATLQPCLLHTVKVLENVCYSVY